MFCFARLYDEQPFDRLTPAWKLLILLACLGLAGGGFWMTTETGSALWLGGAGVLIALVLVALLAWAKRRSPRMPRARLARAGPGAAGPDARGDPAHPRRAPEIPHQRRVHDARREGPRRGPQGPRLGGLTPRADQGTRMSM